MRLEHYQGIIDSIINGETKGNEIGRRIVLPPSFIGGSRDMRRRYLDAMALVRKFGKLDLFITMACNPEWKEITDNLKEGQQPHDRPDLPTRRGMPHMHMLIILRQDSKINGPENFDYYVSEELPNKDKNPNLHNFVVKHMMLGPCGDLNKKNSCMIVGRCKSNYPRQFCQSTTQGKDGYPIYRRRNYGQIVDTRKAKLNNQCVVPHNCNLLLSNSDTVVDEIKNFQDARWVSAQEALWRIFEFDLNEISPAQYLIYMPNSYNIMYGTKETSVGMKGKSKGYWAYKWCKFYRKRKLMEIFVSHSKKQNSKRGYLNQIREALSV
ncbi:uncharacterized protein LOC142519691 [Primulina tabacum]|uniref:uncharacterized protein LOC142519691 n=1 Tax=Primulina tabacum TaxID=48773 RepID=UPI003F59D838